MVTFKSEKWLLLVQERAWLEALPVEL